MKRVFLSETIPEELYNRIDEVANRLNFSKSRLIELILTETIDYFYNHTHHEHFRDKLENNETLKSLQKDFLHAVQKARSLAEKLLHEK